MPAPLDGYYDDLSISDARNKDVKKARKVIKGLLEIAEIAMPDTYLLSDSRIKKAKKWLKKS